MQFRLRELFTFTALCAVLAAFASLIYRHWDVAAVYRGYYGPRGVPDWATGSGKDKLAEAFGGLAHLGVDHAPWMVLMALCCFAAAWGVHAKGGAR